MKYWKHILIFLVVLAIGFVLFNFKSKDKTEEIPKADEELVGEKGGEMEGATKPIELCFAKFGEPDTNGFYDRYILRMIIDGEKVTGELNFLPKDKDSKTGEIQGTVGEVDDFAMARTASLWWYAMAEGMSAKEELKIIFGEGTASVGMGEMTESKDGAYVYKNPNQISYTLDLGDVSCESLVERQNVEEYLKENIRELSPVEPVLGGNWYFVSAIIDTSNNSGTVIYEDGHVEEKRGFTYSQNAKGEISSLSIK